MAKNMKSPKRATAIGTILHIRKVLYGENKENSFRSILLKQDTTGVPIEINVSQKTNFSVGDKAYFSFEKRVAGRTGYFDIDPITKERGEWLIHDNSGNSAVSAINLSSPEEDEEPDETAQFEDLTAELASAEKATKKATKKAKKAKASA